MALGDQVSADLTVDREMEEVLHIVIWEFKLVKVGIIGEFYFKVHHNKITCRT